MWVSIDGVRTDPAAATVSVFDRGFLFGDAIYEVICTSGRRPYKLGPHLDRLVASGDAIGLDIRPLRGDLEREVAALLDAAGPGEGELYIRIMVTGGACPNFDLVDGGPPVRIVMVKPLPTWDPRLFREGIRLQTVNPEEVVGRVAPWVKSNNRQANVMAHRRARAHGYDDGLFVDPDGLISEGPTWNVFCVEGGRVETPRLGRGILPGITRSTVLELCELLGVPAWEVDLSADRAASSDEMFITSTTRGIMAVAALDEHRFDPVPGPVTQRLADALTAEMGQPGRGQ